MHVIETVSLAENRVGSELMRLGSQVFIPTYEREIRHARRVEMRRLVLFPRYIFSDCPDVGRIMRIRGVVGVLRRAGSQKLAIVPVDLLKALRGPDVNTDVVIGDEAVVMSGYWEGLRGVVKKTDAERVTLLFSLLGRDVMKDFSRKCVTRNRTQENCG